MWRGESISPPGMPPSLASVWTCSYSCYALWGWQFSTIRYSATLSNNLFMGMLDKGLQMAHLAQEEAAEMLARCSALAHHHQKPAHYSLQCSLQLCSLQCSSVQREQPRGQQCPPGWISRRKLHFGITKEGRRAATYEHPAPPMASPGSRSWPEITTLLIFLWHPQTEETERAAKQ